MSPGGQFYVAPDSLSQGGSTHRRAVPRCAGSSRATTGSFAQTDIPDPVVSHELAIGTAGCPCEVAFMKPGVGAIRPQPPNVPCSARPAH